LHISARQLRDPASGQAQRGGHRGGRQPLLTILFEEMADEGGTMPHGQLHMFFFME
jgi:hypothetical protein